MNGLSTINLMPSTNNEIDTMFVKIKQEILSGNEDPLKLEVQLKSIEDLVKRLRKDQDIKAQLMVECDKYPDKTFESNGAKFTKTSRASYDYESSEDSIWSDLKTKETDIKTKLKDRETFLKAIKEEVVNSETGEVIYPPIKSSSESISVKLL